MIDDFRTFDGSDEIECDLCIAGAGAAGITLARAFVGTGLRVVVLESGGLDWEDETQDLYVGDSVGLHPVWLILALVVFGSLFGFVGMLVAVPVAAALGVLVRFLIEMYRRSRLYRGVSERGPGDL